LKNLLRDLEASRLLIWEVIKGVGDRWGIDELGSKEEVNGIFLDLYW
jgi:hypothetical protein